MLFSSITFLYYFLPATLLCYLLAPKKLKSAVLLLASLVFYAWGEKLLVLLFALSILVGWAIGIATDAVKSKTGKKLLLALALVYDLGILGYFKYADFFIGNFNALFGTNLALLRVALPIGISFYTFQLLSYNIDVYRGSVPAQKNPVLLGAYVAMFPQLIAGPIVRYSDISERLADPDCGISQTAEGIRRFAIGLGKKVLLANTMGEVVSLTHGSSEASILGFWLYAVCYTLQIYFDFSGYSDMAIGLGRVLGFKFAENFNYPYISASITEFWRRWHISLGSWFRDYVYIPMGGNRCSRARHLFNILVVWMLTGLWHGAAWNFVCWGLFYAVLLTAEKLWLLPRLNRRKVFGHIYVLACVMLGFVIFNADNLSQGFADIAGLFSFGKYPLACTESLYYLRSYGFLILLAVTGATPLPKMLAEKALASAKIGKALSVLEPVFPAALLIITTAYLVDGSFNPFLYFRF